MGDAEMTPKRARELLDCADAMTAWGSVVVADLARAYLAEHEARVAAEAAQALVLEQAASMIEDNVRHAKELGREIWAMPDIRALAPEAGVAELAKLRAERDALRTAVEGLITVLDRNEKKGPIPNVEMMFCWLAAQDVRSVFRKIAQRGETT